MVRYSQPASIFMARKYSSPPVKDEVGGVPILRVSWVTRGDNALSGPHQTPAIWTSYPAVPTLKRWQFDHKSSGAFTIPSCHEDSTAGAAAQGNCSVKSETGGIGWVW